MKRSSTVVKNKSSAEAFREVNTHEALFEGIALPLCGPEFGSVGMFYNWRIDHPIYLKSLTRETNEEGIELLWAKFLEGGGKQEGVIGLEIYKDYVSSNYTYQIMEVTDKASSEFAIGGSVLVTVVGRDINKLRKKDYQRAFNELWETSNRCSIRKWSAEIYHKGAAYTILPTCVERKSHLICEYNEASCIIRFP
jgi:hypothetical protein